MSRAFLDQSPGQTHSPADRGIHIVVPVFAKPSTYQYIIKPFGEKGYPDYAQAINQILDKDANAQNNAAVMFWRAHGAHPNV